MTREARKKLRIILEAALAKKATDPKVLDMSNLIFIVDYFVMLGATSRTQVRAIAENVYEKLDEKGLTPDHVEGQKAGTWVLLDCGDIAVHIFEEETRKFYDLERLWSDAPRIPLVELGIEERDITGGAKK